VNCAIFEVRDYIAEWLQATSDGDSHQEVHLNAMYVSQESTKELLN